MAKSWICLAAIGIAAPLMAQTAPEAPSTTIPDNLSLLAGKRVIVGRVPLCTPKTYSANLTYSGKVATVLSFAPNATMARYGANLSRMPANLRATMEDTKKGGMLTFKFEDGTILDTCADMMLSQLAPNLELAPGETVPAQPAAPSTATAAVAAAGPEQCPLTVAKLSSGLGFGHALVDALTTSELQRQMDETINGGSKNYLDLRVHNDGTKPVRAFEFTAVYRNVMGDETVSPAYLSQNTSPIKPGEFAKAYTMDRSERAQNGRGDVKVYISRIRFTDDSTWEDNGSRSCAGSVLSK